MLEYDRLEVSEGIDVNKTEGLHECIICHYWYFLIKNFKFQLEVFNGSHDLMQKAINYNDVVIVTVKRNNYRIHFLYMSKDKSINLLKNANLTEKSRTL